MDITFSVNGRDLSSRLSTYQVTKNVQYNETVTTMDGYEHVGKRTETYVINFSLLPLTAATATADYTALSDKVFSVTFTDPYNGGNSSTKNFRVANDLESVFALTNIMGDRYYKGAEIQLRETAL